MDFYKTIKKSEKVQKLSKKIRDGKGTLEDVNHLAQAVSEAFGAAAMKELEIGDTPETVASTLAPALKAGHEYVQNMAALVINKQYEDAGVGLRAQKASMKVDRTETMYERIAEVIANDTSAAGGSPESN